MTIRGRLTAWYAGGLCLVLAAFALGFYEAHARSRLSGFDDELARTCDLLARTVAGELGEGLDLGTAAPEALEDIRLPGRTLAVFDARGTLVGGAWPVAVPPRADAPAPEPGPGTVETPGGPVRLLRSRHRHDETVFEVGAAESLLGLERELASLRRAMGGALLVSLIVALAGAFAIAAGALRPLGTMAREARRTEAGAPGFRLAAPDPTDELGALAGSFNDLLGRLERALAQQRQFMADASHELRTPVSIARTALDVALARPSRPEAEYRDALGVVRTQVGRLSRVIDDLLTLARADVPGFRPEWRPLYLDELVAEVVGEAKLLGRAKEVEITHEGPAEVETRGDGRLLRLMLLNLLDNAVRHTRPGSRVRVRLSRTEGAAEVEVSDGGEGIPEADRERIFERFFRLPGARSAEGSGLGLPIARAIAQAHQGSVELLRTDASGSTFAVRLPLPRS